MLSYFFDNKGVNAQRFVEIYTMEGVWILYYELVKLGSDRA